MMMRQESQIFILEQPADVQPFVEDTIRWANSDRNALGFLAAGAFTEFARKGNLFIAAIRHNGKFVYSGHLLFDARHAKATVIQLFVKPEARHHGVAKQLLERLKRHLTDLHFISIYASVAEDLREANTFWEKNDFYIQRTRPGGQVRKRTILVRSHELRSPQLFECSGISSSNLFGLDVGLQTDRPIYLLDLNVLFDLGPRRPRNPTAIELFHAERHGACQLALSAELREELLRTAASAPRTDPMHSWAAIFITFPLPPADEKAYLIEALGTLVFPDRSGRYTANDLADLSHLATAIHHRLSGFITNDEAILMASQEIEAAFNIQVISPQAFQATSSGGSREELFEASSAVNPLIAAQLSKIDQERLRKMLLRLGISDSDVISQWGVLDVTENTFLRSAVLVNDSLAGYLAIQRSGNSKTIKSRLAIDETNLEARDAGRLLLNKILSRARDSAPSKIHLHLAPKQVTAREIATDLGFAGTARGLDLTKLILNRIVTTSNWESTVAELYALAKLKLPAACPIFKDIDQQIEVLCPDGNKRFVRLHEVESALSPALLCLPGRPAVITPILRDFSEQLLEHSPQTTLLPRSRAGQRSERHYISSTRTLKHFNRGTIMLFYESSKGQGSSSIIALARVQKAYLKPQSVIDKSDFDPSVLSPETLSRIGKSESKVVTAFDNVIILPKPVPLSSLQKIGCGKATQLITTRPITSEQLDKILAEALLK